jgi:hypothetical protein
MQLNSRLSSTKAGKGATEKTAIAGTKRRRRREESGKETTGESERKATVRYSDGAEVE